MVLKKTAVRKAVLRGARCLRVAFLTKESACLECWWSSSTVKMVSVFFHYYGCCMHRCNRVQRDVVEAGCCLFPPPSSHSPYFALRYEPYVQAGCLQSNFSRAGAGNQRAVLSGSTRDTFVHIIQHST